MSKAVANMMRALPGSEFYNTGGGCMAIVWPVAGTDGAVVVTGSYGSGQVDNFSRHDADPSRADVDLTGFFATYHADWFSEDYGTADAVEVYASPDFDATGHLDVDGWWPEDEQAYVEARNSGRALAEVAECGGAAYAFVANLISETGK